MVKACTISVRITSASRMAIAIASTYSRRTDLRRRATGSGVTTWPSAAVGVSSPGLGPIVRGRRS